MAELQATDQFLVNRGDQTQTVEQQALMATLQDDDLLLVNRADATYTITGEDLIDSLIDDLIITKPVLSTASPEVGRPITAAASASGGKGPYTYTFQWLKTGDIEIAGATAATYTPVGADEGETLACRITATDVQPESATGTSDYTGAVIKPASPPIIGSIALSENSPGGDRFTGKSFTTSIAMTDDGTPNSDKLLKAEVEGALSIAGATDEIVGIGIASDWNQSQVWSYTTTTSTSFVPGREPQFGFDGSFETTCANAAGDPSQIIVAFNPPLTVNGLVEVVGGYGSGDTGFVTVDGSDTTPVPFPTNNTGSDNFITIFTGSGSLSKITIQDAVNPNSTNEAGFTAIRVNGQLLVDTPVVDSNANTLLTLASDANLANGAFKPGDLVKQNNSPIIPVSSTITNVGTGTSVYSSEIAGTADASWPKTGAFDGVLTTAASPQGSGNSLVWTPTTPIPCLTGWRYRQYVSAPGSSQLLMNGVAVSVSPTDTGKWSSMYSPPAGGLINSLEWFRAGASNAIDIAAIEIDGTILVDGAPFTQLTLQDASGLSDFEIGDETNSVTEENYVLPTITFTAVNTSLDDVFNGTGGGFIRPNGDGTNVETVVFTTPIPLRAGQTLDVKCCKATPDTTNMLHAVINGVEVTAGPVTAYTSWASACSSGEIISLPIPVNGNLEKFWMSGDADNSNAAGICNFTTDGVVIQTGNTLIAAIPAKITAIDAATPSITVDGGSWYGSDGTGDAGDGRYEPEQEWSNLLTSATGFKPNGPAVYAFDGSVGDGSTRARAETNGTDGLMEITLSGLTPNDLVEVYTRESNSGGGNSPSNDVYVEINSTKFISAGPGANEIRIGKVDVNGNVVIKLNSIESNGGNTGWNYAQLEGIGIGGKLLIDSSVPGGQGETFVTGPVKNITGTFVSADPAVPSMTLSSATSGWSANTGNFAQNTVANPITIKPETSAITVVTSDSYSQYGTGTPYSPEQGWQSAFDGNIAQAGGSNTFADGGTTMVWTPPTPIPINGTITFYSYNQEATNVLINGTLNLPVTGNYATPISVPRADLGNVLSSIALTTPADLRGAYFAGVAIDGELLIDGGFTLSLADDTDLNQFVAGDDVYANTSYTPTSSTITNVDALDYSSGLSVNYYVNTLPFEGPVDEIIAANGYLKTVAYNPNETGVWTAPAGGVGTTSVRVDTYFYEGSSFRVVGGGRDVTINPQMSSTGNDESFDGGNITTTIYTVGLNVGEAYVTITGSLLPVERIEVLTTSATRASYIKPIYVDGVRIIDGPTTLTLTDDNTDLVNFRVGDLVQEYGAPTTLDPSDSNGTLSNNDLTFSGLYARSVAVPGANHKIQFEMTVDDNNGGGGLIIGFSEKDSDGTPTTTFTGVAYDSMGIIRSTGNWGGIASGLATYTKNDIVGATLNTTDGLVEFYKNGSLIWSGTIANPDTLKLYVHADTGASSLVTANFGATSFDYPVNGYKAFTSLEPHYITAIDSSTPSITTDGGSWYGSDGSGDPAGETFVTGPTFTGTGTVASTDPSGPTMTLSASTRWAVGTKVTMDEKPAVAINAFLKFDSTGNVTGYQTTDPGYVNMGLGNSKTLTFPATFNSGGTPDAELPAGTSIRTRVEATNPSGSSQSNWSNRVIPGAATLNLGMGETVYSLAGFNAIAAQLTTYEVSSPATSGKANS